MPHPGTIPGPTTLLVPLKPSDQPLWGDFAGLPAFNASKLQDGRFAVTIENGRFDAWFKSAESNRLWILLSAARDPEKVRLPKFDRWSWARRFPGNVLCISDPTLYLDEQKMRIGWYVGTARQDWQGALADLVRHVAAKLNLTTRRTICYGSSAGGFGSMQLAARLGDATAVAINPQTEVLRYARHLIQPLINLGFDGRKPQQLTREERVRLSVIERDKLAPEVRCLYVQNRLDVVHISNHFKKFIQAFQIPEEGGMDPSGRLRAMLYDDPRGHAPEPLAMVEHIVASAISLAETDLYIAANRRMKAEAEP